MAKLTSRYNFDYRRILFEDGYHIEYSITDICNKNCAGCSHLAPLAKKPNFVDIEEFSRVVAVMQKVIPKAHTVWLTGGEPTLHPKFITLLDTVRQSFVDNHVGIFSNGTTLSHYENDSAFWSFIKDAGIVWAITPYDKPKQYFEDLFTKYDC